MQIFVWRRYSVAAIPGTTLNCKDNTGVLIRAFLSVKFRISILDDDVVIVDKFIVKNLFLTPKGETKNLCKIRGALITPDNFSKPLTKMLCVNSSKNAFKVVVVISIS